MRSALNLHSGGRLSRRTLLRSGAVGAAGLAGAALLGCGDSEDVATASPTAAATAAAPTAAATPSEARIKRGGTWRTSATGDPPTLDPYGSGSFATKLVAAAVYSRLFMIDATVGDNPYDRPVTEDIAAGAESTDGQHWVVKLKPGVKFHNVAPVNGRELTTDDVMYSWKRLTAEGSVNASAVKFVTSIDAVDSHTLRFTTDAPSPFFLEVLADANNLWMLPKEADGGFEVTTKPIGSGPWMLKNYQVSSRFEYERHSDYYDAERPYLDSVQEFIIPEYANRRAQFEAGNLHALGVLADDVLDMHSRMREYQWVGEVSGGVQYAYFSSKQMDPDAPWQDARYRQAVSMAIDRAQVMELAYNVKALEAAGLTPSTAWNNIVAVTLGRWWLDPTSAAQGPSSAFFAHNPAEARKLLDAVGGTKDVTWQYAPVRYGTAFDRVAQACANWLTEVGLNVTVEEQDYAAVYFPHTRAGNFHGIALGITPAYPEVGGFVDRYFGETDSNASMIRDQRIDELRFKQAREFDEDARQEQIYDIQRVNGEEMYYLPTAHGAGTAWSVYRPEVRGLRRTRGYGGPTEVWGNLWLDA